MKRDRTAYFAAYHAERREARNAARRAKYVPRGRRPGRPLGAKTRPEERARKAATDSYRAARYLSLEADLRARTAAELSAASLNPELARLIAEQARDDRRLRIKYNPEPRDCWRSAA